MGAVGDLDGARQRRLRGRPMAQISSKLRRTSHGYAHWCPACDAMHGIHTNADDDYGWSFDGSGESPTFSPSVRITGKQNGVDFVCHYFIIGGVIHYQNDCTHHLKGQHIVLPPLPPQLRD